VNLTAVVLNHLPAKLLKSTLKSVSFADEVIIIHDPRESRLQRITSQAKVFTRPLKSFASQRNFALKKASSDWVLFIDSDETVSNDLKQEINRAIKSASHQGYLLPRQDIVLGKTLRYGETGQTMLLRLAKKSAGKFSRSVHEKWILKGRVGELKNPLYHFKNNLVSDFIKRIILYSPIDSHSLLKENKPFSYFSLIFKPPVKFVYNYIVRRGIQDGLLGLFHAYLMSVQSLSVRVFQWQDARLSTKTAKL
jgi:glycosyltransferase involved in cell wall biosynthesis